MKASRRPTTVLIAGPALRSVLVGILLTVLLAACTDDSGAIDGEGHNGYDVKACTDLVVMASGVNLDALTQPQASAEAERIGQKADRAGDASVREASGRLRAAYRANDPQAASDALTDFASACAW
jgi:hypothetical protein